MSFRTKTQIGLEKVKNNVNMTPAVDEALPYLMKLIFEASRQSQIGIPALIAG